MKAITPEQLRIMVAAAQSRLKIEPPNFRYEIEGEEPPDRRDRERLQKRGLLERVFKGRVLLTEKGIDALKSAPVAEDAPKAEQLNLGEIAGGGASVAK